ncbi:MAG: ROK family protein [Kiritimatiellia bacterium]|jgi:glucokinase
MLANEIFVFANNAGWPLGSHPDFAIQMNILGIDIGGTKTSVCVGAESGQLALKRRMATCPENGPDKVLERIVALAREVMAQSGRADIDTVGLAAPGPLDVKRGAMLAPPNMPGWDFVPVVSYFAAAFRRPVFMNNDANAGALAEYHFGRGRGVANMVYLTHSTGMGGGVIVDGRLVQGTVDMAGEVGHFVLDPQGPVCPCGLRGCFEVYCGGRNVALRLRQKIAAEGIATTLTAKAGGQLAAIDFKLFVEAVREQDPFAVREWQAYVERLAQGMGIIIMTLNPDMVVLGTIACQTGDLLMVPLKACLRRFAWGAALDACRIETSALGADIGDLGAIAVAVEGLKTKDKGQMTDDGRQPREDRRQKTEDRPEKSDAALPQFKIANLNYS